jgi:hypothetical protein
MTLFGRWDANENGFEVELKPIIEAEEKAQQSFCYQTAEVII